MQNGPQRVFVALEYTPWILRLTAYARLETHTGADPGDLLAAAIDEEGNLLLNTTLGPGLLDDRDLPHLLDRLQGRDGRTLEESSPPDTLLETFPTGMQLRWQDRCLPLQAVKRAEMANRFGFVATPAAPSKG